MLQFLSTPKESRFRIRKKRSQKNRDVNEDSESGSLITSTVISVADHDKTRKWVSRVLLMLDLLSLNAL